MARQAGKDQRAGSGAHRFARPAHTFRALLSFGARLPRQSSHVGRRPLQAGAGSAAITLARRGQTGSQ